MYERRPGLKYRLVDKPRFCTFIVAAVLIVGAVVCVVYGMGNFGHAADQSDEPVNAQKATQKPDAAKTGTAPAKSSQNNDWRLVLVNLSHPLPEGYTVKTRALPNGLLFDERAYDDLMDMIRDGKNQGLSFVICSAYRTIEKQQKLFDEQVGVEQAAGLSYDEAVETTKTKVAWPGTSEHNLGLAVDIVALSYQKLDRGYLDTPECQWLMANCYKYGFIVRYPENKSKITKIIFEPWHYRYVGVEAATEITEKGLCLEEYLGMAD
jgi:D-alanyl-D-alanine carboxypeptidase